MEYLIIWLLFGFAAMIVASGKERDGCGWFLLGCLFGPFALVVAALPSLKKDPGSPAAGTHAKCPHCAETVLREAKVCKHCGREIEGALIPYAPPPTKSIGALDVMVAIIIGSILFLIAAGFLSP